jgi:hypothetical protein
MIGVIFFFFMGIYLTISFFIVRWTSRCARKTGRGVKRWAFAAALAMYLLLFWDHIPTLLLHKYYCATKAGFWVYKTPEQWKTENPGVAQTLTWKSMPPPYTAPNVTDGYRLNERFAWVIRTVDTPVLPVSLDYESIIDIKTGETMVKRIIVGSGYGNIMTGGENWKVLKFWVRAELCDPNGSEFYSYKKAFKQMGREVK